MQDNYVFDAKEFEKELAQPFVFDHQGETFKVKECEVELLERYQNPLHCHGKPFLGKHHQIRRMAHNHGYCVLGLKRVRISGILSVDSVPLPGDCRWLTVQEYEEISRHLGVDVEYYSEKHRVLKL
eukprot:gene36904-45528_t